MDKNRKITIYTDGAAKGNPGRAGWGAVFIVGGKEKQKVLGKLVLFDNI